MTEPTALQKVFIVKGVRRILEVTAGITVCKTYTWAQVGRRRYLLGTSAFFTRKAAEVRKLGELRKLAGLWGGPYHAVRIGEAARQQLAEFNATGTIH